MNMNNHEEMPDPQKIKEIMDVITEKIPGLLKQLGDLLYGPKSAKQFAEAAAIFYKELKNAGMTDAQAFELTQQYMQRVMAKSQDPRLASRNFHAQCHLLTNGILSRSTAFFQTLRKLHDRSGQA